MDILSLLEEVQNESLILRHPLAEEDVSITFAYTVGVGIIAAATGSLSASGKIGLEKLAAEFNLPKFQNQKILETVIAPDKMIVKSIVNAVNQSSWQYLFLLDAHKLAIENENIGEKYEQAMGFLMNLFKLTYEQKQLWENLVDSVFAHDFGKSETIFKEIYGKKSSCIYQALVYYLPKQSKATLEQLKKTILEEKKRVGFLGIQLEICSESNKWYNPWTCEEEEIDYLNLHGEDLEQDEKGKKEEIKVISTKIIEMENKVQALIAAFDSMYLFS